MITWDTIKRELRRHNIQGMDALYVRFDTIDQFENYRRCIPSSFFHSTTESTIRKILLKNEPVYIFYRGDKESSYSEQFPINSNLRYIDITHIVLGQLNPLIEEDAWIKLMEE